MRDEKLVHMVNQIAQFFEPMPDRPQALVDVAEHVHRFWDPRMRRQLLEHLDQRQGAGLSELARQALTLHRTRLE